MGSGQQEREKNKERERKSLERAAYVLTADRRTNELRYDRAAILARSLLPGITFTGWMCLCVCVYALLLYLCLCGTSTNIVNATFDLLSLPLAWLPLLNFVLNSSTSAILCAFPLSPLLFLFLSVSVSYLQKFIEIVCQIPFTCFSHFAKNFLLFFASTKWWQGQPDFRRCPLAPFSLPFFLVCVCVWQLI